MSMILLTLLAVLADFPGKGAVEVPLTACGRVMKGLELFLQCKRAARSCALVGVDPSDRVLEGQSLNTWQNAQYCAA